MSMRCFAFSTTSVPTTFSLLKHLTSSSISKPPLLLLHCSLLTSMSSRPNFQGGRRGGGGRGGGGGEQRWWDPVWRAQKLAQKAAEYEVLDENEWWNKMEGFQKGGEQELIFKRLFRREDQQLLSDMAQQLGLYL